MIMLSVSKVHASLLACALAVAGFATAVPAVAQGQRFTVEVPFEFQNGAQHLPAGTYNINVESQHMISLRTASTGGFAMTNPTESSKVSQTGKVIFERYGDRYFLHEIKLAGSTSGVRCVKTRSEKQLQVAQLAVPPSNVELALNALPR